MSILISPSRSLPPPRQWIDSAASLVRLLHGSRNSAGSASPGGAPEQRATPLVH